MHNTAFTSNKNWYVLVISNTYFENKIKISTNLAK